VINEIVTHVDKSGKSAIAPLLSSGAYFDGQYKAHHKPSTVLPGYTATRSLKMPTPAQSRRIPNMQRWKVSVHADMLKIKASDYDTGRLQRGRFPGGSKTPEGEEGVEGIAGDIRYPEPANRRGSVRGFSRASRKRMIEFMAKVRDTGAMFFATLTYPDHCPHNDDGAWNADFEAFRRRFERAYPTYRAIWRMELVARKSGDYIGVICPHYHLLIFADRSMTENETEETNDTLWAWLSNNWFEIASQDDDRHLEHGSHCNPVRSRKHAYAYVSKYVAKKAEDGLEVGRRWGRIGAFDTSASETHRLTDDEYVIFRRLVKRWLRNRSRAYASRWAKQSPSAGCTVFGLGDTRSDGIPHDVCSPHWQFIVEAKRQCSERETQEYWQSD